jgi:hypothetical protein
MPPEHMQYLDPARLESIDAAAFHNADPYPWINPAGLLTEDGYRQLLDTLPDVELFTPVFGLKRAHGQRPHDRYTLEYAADAPIEESWKSFIAELEGPVYRRFLERMLGTKRFFMSYHWHYTPNGCEVSPHCDAKRKFGSHIFYFNTARDWDPSWGGETVILDDHGRFKRNSAPEFEDFDRQISSEALGNYSLLFKRRGNSWHGVRKINCPEGHLRKVFIVVINSYSPSAFFHHLFGRKISY